MPIGSVSRAAFVDRDIAANHLSHSWLQTNPEVGQSSPTHAKNLPNYPTQIAILKIERNADTKATETIRGFFIASPLVREMRQMSAANPNG